MSFAYEILLALVFMVPFIQSPLSPQTAVLRTILWRIVSSFEGMAEPGSGIQRFWCPSGPSKFNPSFFRCEILCHFFRKIPAPIKIKLAPTFPGPPKKPKSPPPLKQWILWAWRFPWRKNQKSQAPIKLVQPFPALESWVKNVRARGFLSINIFFFLGVSYVLFSHLLVVNKFLHFWPSQTD